MTHDDMYLNFKVRVSSEYSYDSKIAHMHTPENNRTQIIQPKYFQV